MKLKMAIVCLISLFFAACSTGHQKYNTRTAGKLPIYGNWCGPDHPIDTSKAPDPIDALDASCKTHDLCYEDKGYFNCDCDAQLTQTIRQSLRTRVYKSRQEKRMARTVHNYFKASPCEGDTRDKVAPTRAIQNVYKKGEKVYKKGEKMVIDIWDKFNDDDENKPPEPQNEPDSSDSGKGELI